MKFPIKIINEVIKIAEFLKKKILFEHVLVLLILTFFARSGFLINEI